MSQLATDRLDLEPLRVDHAEEMTAVLGDPALYVFTGGEPPSTAELRRRYALQVAGRSPDGEERWLNWIVRRRAQGDAIGYVQATVRGGAADVAWVIGVPWQGRGYAAEAAMAIVAWLGGPVTAHIHPDHKGSASVARRLGLEPTDEIEDGEVVWRG